MLLGVASSVGLACLKLLPVRIKFTLKIWNDGFRSLFLVFSFLSLTTSIFLVTMRFLAIFSVWESIRFD